MNAKEALTVKQIEEWKMHFKSEAQTGDITVTHWHELRALCDMALRTAAELLRRELLVRTDNYEYQRQRAERAEAQLAEAQRELSRLRGETVKHPEIGHL